MNIKEGIELSIQDRKEEKHLIETCLMFGSL